MKVKIQTISYALASVALAAAAPSDRFQGESRVSVVFLHPENYRDAGTVRSGRENAALLKTLGVAMQKSAAAYLREDLRLEVNVTNVDLAGGVEPWRGGTFSELRVMRDVYPPRQALAYRLMDRHGHVVARGESKLSNPNFQFGTKPDSDPLRYDKALFRDWLRIEFVKYRK